MQNPDTGHMHQVPDGIGKAIRDLADTAGTPVPLFQIGEEIELRGGRFRVVAMGKRFIRLEGLPGTKVKP